MIKRCQHPHFTHIFQKAKKVGESLRDYPEISLPPVLLFDQLKFQMDSDGGHMEGKVCDSEIAI